MNEHESVMAAAVAVADTCTATARSMAAYGRVCSGELKLWMVCSIMTAAAGARQHDIWCWSLKLHSSRERRDLFSFHTGS